MAPMHNKHNPNPTPESTKSPSAAAAGAQSAKLHNSKDGRGSPPTVDSWEDIDDEVSETSRQPLHPASPAESAKLTSAVSESASEMTLAEETTTEQSVEDNKLEIADTAATSSSSSIGSTGSSNRKNPSPNLSKTAKMEVVSRPAATVLPPPDNKENLNVIFIGHVGKCDCFYQLAWT